MMIDVQWVTNNDTDVHQDENTNENVYSEVTSGCWYKRTCEKMMSRYARKDISLFSFSCCVST